MPFVLVIAILAYCSLLGIAVSSLLTRRIGATTALVAPVIGTGLALPLVLSFNRLGIPIAVCGPVVVAVLGILALIVVVVRRPHVPWRALLPVMPAVIGGIVLTGFPLAMYGFDWLANLNGDMTIYTGSAAQLLHHGFFDAPALPDLVSGADSAMSSLWYWEVAPPNRYGADVYLAIVSSITHMHPVYIYMSCSVASFAMLIMATAAMCTRERYASYAVPVCAVLIALASPFTMFSVVQQVLPQLSGLAAMVAVVALAQAMDFTDRTAIQRGISLAMLFAALELLYPEITPVLIFGFVVATPFFVYRNRAKFENIRRYAIVAAMTVVTFAVLLNAQLPTLFTTFRVLTKVATSLQTGVAVGTINYFIIPSGIAAAWGLVPVGVYAEPWLSIAIALGAIFCVVCAVASVRALGGGRLSAAMLVAIEILCVILFVHRVSYAIFKMVFVLQPFLAVLVARAALQVPSLVKRWRVSEAWHFHRPVVVSATVTVMVLSTAYSTYIYLGAASDLFAPKMAIFSGLLSASSNHVMRQMRAIADRPDVAQGMAPMRSDSTLSQFMFLEDWPLPGRPMSFSGADPYSELFRNAVREVPSIAGWPAGVRVRAKAIAKKREEIFKWHGIRLSAPFQSGKDWLLHSNDPNGKEGTAMNVFIAPSTPEIDAHFSAKAAGTPDEGYLLETGPEVSVLNRSSGGPGPYAVRAVRWHDVKNWLNLADSSIGRAPNLTTVDGINALGTLEPDPFLRSRTLTVLGRSMILEIFNPSPTVSLRLDLSASLNSLGYDELPSFTIIGQKKVTLSAMGARGAARLITPPVKPLEYLGHKYIFVVVDHRTVSFPEKRSFLMSIFGRDAQLDPRQFTAFVRDISVAAPLPAPRLLGELPLSLENPALIYSGLYEDGWLSKRFTVRLHSNAKNDALALHLEIPLGVPDSVFDLKIDSQPARRFTAQPGTARDLHIASPGPGDHDISIVSSNVAPISASDQRIAWAHLSGIAFEPSRANVDDITHSGVTILNDKRWYAFERFQGRTFRWARDGAALSIAPASVPRRLHLVLAPGPSVQNDLHLGASLGKKSFAFSIQSEGERTIDIPPATIDQNVVLHVPRGTAREPGDPRELAVRIFSASLENK
jgi:hypothetical protein